MSDSVRPQKRQPTRLPHPRDSPGKNTGVGCHFLFQCMKVKSESEVAQSCLTHSDPMDCSLPGSSIHGILSRGKWIKKLWYVYTVEYYSAIKMNTSDSVLTGWMNLEPIIQREVSQKEKNKYHILTRIYGEGNSTPLQYSHLENPMDGGAW